MPYYLLFFRYKDAEGGAEDFHSAHTDGEAAKQAGIAYWADGVVHLSSWMHLAEFDGKTLRITHTLNIPGTEYADGADDDRLEWRPYAR